MHDFNNTRINIPQFKAELILFSETDNLHTHLYMRFLITAEEADTPISANMQMLDYLFISIFICLRTQCLLMLISIFIFTCATFKFIYEIPSVACSTKSDCSIYHVN